MSPLASPTSTWTLKKLLLILAELWAIISVIAIFVFAAILPGVPGDQTALLGLILSLLKVAVLLAFIFSVEAAFKKGKPDFQITFLGLIAYLEGFLEIIGAVFTKTKFPMAFLLALVTFIGVLLQAALLLHYSAAAMRAVKHQSALEQEPVKSDTKAEPYKQMA
jgi:hypothetical protein